MLNQKRNLFRQESLERLSSPERLDQLMQVVNPRSWLPLIALVSITGVAVFWSIYGNIPITVEGRGILIYPRKVIPLQAKNPGQIIALNVKVGDTVKKGQVLATIAQVETRKQLGQQRNKLRELQLQDRTIKSIQELKTLQTKVSIAQQRQYLQESIRQLQALSPLIKNKSGNFIEQQRDSLQQSLEKAKALTPLFQERMAIRQKLYQERLITNDVDLESKQQYVENQEKIADLQAKLKELDFNEAEQEKDYRDNLGKIADFQAQLKELDSKTATQAQEDLESRTTRQKEIQETTREIAKLEVELKNNSQIISQISGRILEITVAPGQVVNTETRLASISEGNSDNKLLGITYFPVADGKKIQPGMEMQITPQTIKRERFGGIVGNVKNVSAFPITKETAISIVGNPEVVESLVSSKQQGGIQAGLIQVSAELEPDSKTFSGYQWSSSSGPQIPISSGTTTTVRVKVEDRSPISFVLPILRSVSGIY
jgi:HlyD family secretion protein